MKVAMLITVTDPEHYTQCTLSLDTVRVGFPTAEIFVTVNGPSYEKEDIFHRCRRAEIRHNEYTFDRHHADWVATWVLHREFDEPLFIVDPDCIFWESCEWMAGLSILNTVDFAGMRVPTHQNHWSGGVYKERIHTSFMLFPNVGKLSEKLGKFTRIANLYRPYNFFHPFTVFEKGTPTFYDVCANLYHTVPSYAFTPSELSCYDHINCASFYKEMCQLFAGEPERLAGFKRVHELAVTDPSALRGLWKETLAYYHQQAL